jgi:hypothetical protein
MVQYQPGQPTWPLIEKDQLSDLKIYDTLVKKVFSIKLNAEEVKLVGRCDPHGQCFQNLKILYANQCMKKQTNVVDRKTVGWLKAHWFPHLYKQVGAFVLYWLDEIPDEDISDVCSIFVDYI